MHANLSSRPVDSSRHPINSLPTALDRLVWDTANANWWFGIAPDGVTEVHLMSDRDLGWAFFAYRDSEQIGPTKYETQLVDAASKAVALLASFTTQPIH